jgi:hypothetical protein
MNSYPKIRNDDSLKPVFVFMFFLTFYFITFNTGGFEKFFYSIDGKVEYEQMTAIVGGNLSLLIAPYKHLGLSLIEIPFYILGAGVSQLFHIQLNPVFALLVSPVIASLICLVVFLIIRLLSSQKVALIITLLYGFCTLIWPYSKADVADPLFTLSNLAVFWALLSYDKKRNLIWFISSLVFMATTYIAKLAGHGFLLGWIFFVYISDRKYSVRLRETSYKLLCIFILWCLFIPVNLSIYKAHTYDSGWSWFHEFGYKLLIRILSPLDGLFWYCPLLFLVLFSVKSFIKKFSRLFIFIILLILPYFITLNLGKDALCFHDFASRYDMVYTSLLLIMLIPLIEDFSKINLFGRIVCIFVFIFSFYVQFLGSSVSILYYANLIGQDLGSSWRSHWFAWQYSPFGIYPRLIFQALSGISVPIKGIDVSPGSIDLPFQIDYFWVANNSLFYRSVFLLLIIIFIVLGIYLFRRGNLFNSVKKYYKEFVPVLIVFLIILSLIFIPKELFLNRRVVPVQIANSGLEKFIIKNGKVFPEGWELFDCSGRDGKSSLDFVINHDKAIEGLSALEIVPNQSNIVMSLASPFFDVSRGQIIEARLLVSKNNTHRDTIRIALTRKAGDVFYYSPTTKIRDFNNNWNEMICKVLVPKKAVKAQVYFNIWGSGIDTNERILIDCLKVKKYIY